MTGDPAGAARSTPAKNSSLPVQGEMRGPKCDAGSTRSVESGRHRGRLVGERGLRPLALLGEDERAFEAGDVSRQPRGQDLGVRRREQARLRVQPPRPVRDRHAVEKGDAADEIARVERALAGPPQPSHHLRALPADGRRRRRDRRRSFGPRGAPEDRRDRHPERQRQDGGGRGAGEDEALAARPDREVCEPGRSGTPDETGTP